MNLRDKFNLTGRVAVCDTTPMPSNDTPIVSTEQVNLTNTSKISDDAIKRITESVLSKLNK
jgi:hypothetical protein